MVEWDQGNQAEQQPPPMPERLLPAAVLEKASVRGYEYAWRIGDLPEVIAAARSTGLANLGGQIQFRIPQGTCELYWHEVDVTPRRPEEPWAQYVDRTANDALTGVGKLRPVADLISDGVRYFDVLRALQSRGADLAEFLYMVMCFKAEAA